jgi:hypothetical protein
MFHLRSRYAHRRGAGLIRDIAVAGVLALAGACTQPQAGRCDFTHAARVAFTSPEAQDQITVRSFGASCDKAIGVYEVTDAEGHPIWAWATPLQRAFGDVFTAEDPEHMQAFLEQWAQPAIMTAQQAPEFRQLTPGQTTLDEFTYSDIRVRDLPMLCHFSGTARQICVFWEPIAGGAGLLYERDVEESLE